jgi:uncharacterized protein (TIGR00299 family) protein
MIKIGYFDCFSGASGDMIVGAMLAAGLSESILRSELAKLHLDGYELSIEPIRKQGFAAIKFDVRMQGPAGHRHLSHINAIIDKSDLSAQVKETARKVFLRLGEAEAKVHGTTIEKVHFHEVGAVDAIVDIVSAAIGIQSMQLDRILCSPIPAGSGTVHCEHGLMPVPAPATAELLRGVPLAATDEVGELTTPTGAAILTSIASSFGPVPAMTIRSTGFGAGTRDGRTRPNVLRLIVGDAIDGSPASRDVDEIVILETNLDDATGQQIGHAFDALFAAGALDVFTTPIQMKKNRPGVLLSVIAAPELAGTCEEILFSHTPTFGIRRHASIRSKLERRIETVETAYGMLRVKLGLLRGKIVHIMPEYDDCVRIARERAVTFQDVSFEAQRAGRARFLNE